MSVNISTVQITHFNAGGLKLLEEISLERQRDFQDGYDSVTQTAGVLETDQNNKLRFKTNIKICVIKSIKSDSRYTAVILDG